MLIYVQNFDLISNGFSYDQICGLRRLITRSFDNFDLSVQIILWRKLEYSWILIIIMSQCFTRWNWIRECNYEYLKSLILYISILKFFIKLIEKVRVLSTECRYVYTFIWYYGSWQIRKGNHYSKGAKILSNKTTEQLFRFQWKYAQFKNLDLEEPYIFFLYTIW